MLFNFSGRESYILQHLVPLAGGSSVAQSPPSISDISARESSSTRCDNISPLINLPMPYVVLVMTALHMHGPERGCVKVIRRQSWHGNLTFVFHFLYYNS